MKIAIAWASVSDAIRDGGTSEIRTSIGDGSIGLEGASFEQRQVQFQIPFATGPRSEVYVVFSNNGGVSGPPTLGIGNAMLMTMGPTRSEFTRLPRTAIRSIQKRLFTTWHMLPLVLTGTALLALAGRFRTLLVLVAVPLYYLSAQSVLHTEYRYTLGIHYFAFILAGVALYCAIALCYRAVKWSALTLGGRLGLRQAGRES
jgi:hypothetical protein